MTTTHLALEEYLKTDYEPDCDYIDGDLEERNTRPPPTALLYRYLHLNTATGRCCGYCR